jgi:Protein of unknown function (DUF2808)
MRANIMATKTLTTRLLAALALSGCLVASWVPVIQAQGLPGLVIFSGVERENQLSFRLDYGGRPFQRDRYRLRISRQKMLTEVSEFTVTYPETYEGTFDDDNIDLRINGENVDLDQVTWDRESREILIYPVEPVAANTRVEIVLSNVDNPRTGGTYYFNALVRTPGDIPLRRYLGTWIISIGRE